MVDHPSLDQLRDDLLIAQDANDWAANDAAIANARARDTLEELRQARDRFRQAVERSSQKT